MTSTKTTHIVLKKKHDIRKIAQGYGARNVSLFGSFATGAATESSDVDILVELEAGRTLLDLVAIKQDLEDLLGRPVHVVTAAALSSYLREDVLKEAVAL
ncbi:MAG: nucleotidyltransferase family protein [Syntrophorhabdales bacterium]